MGKKAEALKGLDREWARYDRGGEAPERGVEVSGVGWTRSTHLQSSALHPLPSGKSNFCNERRRKILLLSLLFARFHSLLVT